MPDEKRPIGRPTIMTPEVLRKLEEAFSIGCSDLEACLYADISSATLYGYQNANPDFLERKNQLKEKPVLKARQTMAKALEDPDHARWYLERKKKSEFAPRQETTGADGEPFKVQVIAYRPVGAIRADHVEAHLKDDNDSTQLPPASVPASVPSERSPVQDSGAPQASREVDDGAERAGQ